MKLTKLEELANRQGRPLTEAKGEYSDSAEFTDEFYGVIQQITAIKKIMKSPRWAKWMQSTDENFGTKVVSKSKDATFALDKLDEALRNLDTELSNAE